MRPSALFRFALALWPSLWGGACGDALPATEIIFSVETDIDSVTEVDTIIRRAREAPVEATSPLGPGDVRRLVLWYRGGPVGPVRVTFQAVEETQPQVIAVSTVREAEFLVGRRLEYPVHLSRGCIFPSPTAPSCSAAETCELGRCRPIEVAGCENAGTCPPEPPPDGGISPSADGGP